MPSTGKRIAHHFRSSLLWLPCLFRLFVFGSVHFLAACRKNICFFMHTRIVWVVKLATTFSLSPAPSLFLAFGVSSFLGVGGCRKKHLVCCYPIPFVWVAQPQGEVEQTCWQLLQEDCDLLHRQDLCGRRATRGRFCCTGLGMLADLAGCQVQTNIKQIWLWVKIHGIPFSVVFGHRF